MCVLLMLLPLAGYGILYLLLNASGSHLLILLFAVPLLAACLEYRLQRSAGKAAVLKNIRRATMLLATLFFILFIISISDTMYSGWFKLLQEGKANGTVSFLFSFTAGYFMSLGGIRIVLWRRRRLAILLTILLAALILLLLFPGTATALLFSLSIACYTLDPHPVQSSRDASLSGSRGIRSSWQPVASRSIALRAAAGRVPRHMLKLLMFGLAMLATLALLVWTPPLGHPEAKGDRAVDYAAHMIRSGLLSIAPDLPITYNIPGYGHPYATSSFTGARPYLTELVLFTAEASPGTTLYLKTDHAYHFNGNVWVSGTPKRPEPPIPIPATSADPYSIITGDPRFGGSDLSPATISRTLVTVQADMYPRIPLTLNTIAFQIGEQLYPATRGEMVEPAGGIPLGHSEEITLYSYPQQAALQRMTDAELVQQVTQLPREVQNTFSDLALSLAGESTSETLKNIRSYFAGSFTYTLDTRASEDPIADFLFQTQQGYCIHFSSAAAILARLNGIPVRIAKGFVATIPRHEEDTADVLLYERGLRERTDDPESTGIAYITGYASHQWPEVFIEGSGWMLWEVTPPMIGLVSEIPYREIPADAVTREQLAALGIAVGEQASKDDTAAKSSGWQNIPWLGITIPLIAAILLATLLLPFLLPLDRKVAHLLRRVIKRGRKRRALPSPADTGWQLWGVTLTEKLPGDADTISSTVAAIIRYTYSPEPIGEPDKHTLLTDIRKLLALMRRGKAVRRQ